MKKTLLASVIVLGMGILASPSHADLSFDIGKVFYDKLSLDITSPLAIISFKDLIDGDIFVKITNHPQLKNEFTSRFDLNSLIPIVLQDLGGGIFFQTKSGEFAYPGFGYTQDYHKADGDGYFDIMLSFATSDGLPTRFTTGDAVVFTLIGAGLTSANFNFMSVELGGEGTYQVAAHVQSLTGGDSTWIGDGYNHIPEPTTMLLFGTGLLGLSFIARKKNF